MLEIQDINSSQIFYSANHIPRNLEHLFLAQEYSFITAKNSTKVYQIYFHEGVLKLLHGKLWKIF